MSARAAYAPDERQALLLHAALDAPADALRAWAPAYDALERDLRHADQHARTLLPLVYANLCAAGAEHEAMPELRTLHRVSAFRNERQLRTAGRAVSELADAGIEAVLFKGAAMCALYYAHPGDRMMADVDVLVRPDDAPRAAQVLERAGWESTARPGIGLRHALGFGIPPDAGLDLHGRPVHEPVDPEPFWQAAGAASIGGAEVRVLHPSDELLVMCVHAQYPNARGTRWVADVAVLVRAAGKRLDWQRLVARAEELQVTAAVERALRIAREDFGVPVPDAALTRLAAAKRPLFERVGHTVRARRPPRGAVIAVQWSDYRRLRRVMPAASASGFPRYLRDVSGTTSWRELARLYTRRSRPRT